MTPTSGMLHGQSPWLLILATLLCVSGGWATARFFERMTAVSGALRATVTVSRNGQVVRTLHPEKRVYTAQESAMTEAAIASSLTGDLYVSMGDPLEGGAFAIKLQSKPFVTWIWAGAFLMALGGLLAATDRRYRSRGAREPASAVHVAGASA